MSQTSPSQHDKDSAELKSALEWVLEEPRQAQDYTHADDTAHHDQGQYQEPLQNDAQALHHWLQIFEVRNRHTYRSYRREALRFRMFLENFYGDHPHLLRNATEMDVQCYMHAMLGEPIYHSNLETKPDITNAPRLAQSLLTKSSVRLPALPFNNTMNENGVCFQPRAELLEKYGFTSRTKPFQKPVKKSTLALSMQILSAMYEFWRTPTAMHNAPYALANPVRRIRLSQAWGTNQTERYLPTEAIRAMQEHLDQEGKGMVFGTAAYTIYQRSRLIFALLFGLWMRREEAINLKMGSFTSTLDGWCVNFKRKGGKIQSLPVSNWIMQELFEYRAAMGLPEKPSPDETIPALITRRQTNHTHSMTESTMYRCVKMLAERTARKIQTGEIQLQMPAHLSAEQVEHRKNAILEKLHLFSPHWFRHSAATIAINTGRMSLKTASRTLAHQSEHITSSMYHHADEDAIKQGLDSMADILKPSSFRNL